MFKNKYVFHAGKIISDKFVLQLKIFSNERELLLAM